MFGEIDYYLFSEGTHWQLFDKLGAHVIEDGNWRSTRFAVWAPAARHVAVVGNFNGWDRNQLSLEHRDGVWEGQYPRDLSGEVYKFAIEDQYGVVHYRFDPFSRSILPPPDNSSVVEAQSKHHWTDYDWMNKRRELQSRERPIAIYEVHLGSWRHKGSQSLDYDELANELIPYVASMGFTHIELLPIFEHPFTGSWGYQPLGLYAATSRYGSPDGLRRLINAAHLHNIGVIIDWVPAHFPNDTYGLARFDGTPLYEYEDPMEGVHPHWDTMIYDFRKPQVRNYLIASTIFWAHSFHIDGFRVDAVAAMLYRDYGRENGNYIANHFGGKENLEAIAFLKQFNTVIHREAPAGLITIAEDSTAWPGVTRSVDYDGLGFDFKWNMGWMNDTLLYMSFDPIYRQFHHRNLTFGITYAWAENYILPLSHDEVVYGKHALVNKMPGDIADRFAQLRLLFAYQYLMPGKKLIFMGSEFGVWNEWSHDQSLNWECLHDELHSGVQRLIRDLNWLYRTKDYMADADIDPQSFRWISCDDAEHSVIALRRTGGRNRHGAFAIFNFTPVQRNYRVGVPQPGVYLEIFNSQSGHYGGQNVGNLGICKADAWPYDGYPWSIEVNLPGLTALIFE